MLSSPKTEVSSVTPITSIPNDDAALNALVPPKMFTFPNEETPAKRLPEIKLPLTNKAEFPVNDESKLKPSVLPKFKLFVLFIVKLSIEAIWVSLSSSSISSEISSLSSSKVSSDSSTSTSSISSDNDESVSIWFKVWSLTERGSDKTPSISWSWFKLFIICDPTLAWATSVSAVSSCVTASSCGTVSSVAWATSV